MTLMLEAAWDRALRAHRLPPGVGPYMGGFQLTPVSETSTVVL